MMPTLSLVYPEPDVAQLIFDFPGRSVNLLTSEVLEELATQLAALERRTDLTGLVISSGKPGTFLAGADLRQLAATRNRTRAEVMVACERGRRLFQRLGQCPMVTVAAIDGACVGGGAELALWCDRRVMSHHERTELGFPEVKVGLLPGWGGTVRTPRLVGLPWAIEMITSGESLDAEACRAIGLAVDVVPRERLLQSALAVVRDEQQTGQFRGDRERWNAPVELAQAEMAFLSATAGAEIRRQTRGHYPAPVAALNLLLETAGADLEIACRREAEELAGLFGGPVNVALLNGYFLSERTRREGPSPVGPSRVMRSVGIVGAGTMGAGIAAAHVKRGFSVILHDASPDALVQATRQVLEEAAYDKRLKRADPERAFRFAPWLTSGSGLAEVAAADLVIEAIVEKREVKQGLLCTLERLMRDDAPLVSNTSTIPISRLAESLTRPERFGGLHFFNPVRRMRLVEVIRGPKTSDETVAALVAHAKRIGKLPIVVRDGPGFLVNRILFPYLQEALALLEEGAEPSAIERAATSFGMPLGPLELFDMVGLDTAAFAGRTLIGAFRDRAVASPILPALMEQGRLGRKSGGGFYVHRQRGRAELDPQLMPRLAPHVRERRSFTAEELTSRLFLPMLVEATRVLEEGLVDDPRDIDVGLLYGIGFPAFRGGLLFWADTLGAARVVETLTPFESLGPRFHPTGLLRDMARHGTRFYRATVA